MSAIYRSAEAGSTKRPDTEPPRLLARLQSPRSAPSVMRIGPNRRTASGYAGSPFTTANSPQI